MRRAAAALIGEHDVAAFGGSPGAGRSTRRRILRADVCRRGELVSFEIEANAFLPHQVRRTAGALVEVGRGRLTPERFAGWLADPEPNAAGPAAPPQGLCLMAVRYDAPVFGPGWDDEDER
jgi:tRNA pseudouridine38-40 synthase